MSERICYAIKSGWIILPYTVRIRRRDAISDYLIDTGLSRGEFNQMLKRGGAKVVKVRLTEITKGTTEVKT